MRPLHSGDFPKKPFMALLTAEEVSMNSSIQWADHSDTHALFLKKVGRFVGCNQDGVILIGKEDLFMVDGVWVIEEDPNTITRIQEISALELVLNVIK